jgi:gamma-glutamylcyclotransferase (GGCT)/AIG2-like uncharacterized protein YtfP
MTRHLFTYGSLMFEAVWSQVTGGRHASLPARLPGYRRRGLQGEVYPAIIAGGPDDAVADVLYLDLDATDIRALDEFEGELYQRRAVTCRTDAHGVIAAQTYVLKDEYRHLLGDADWDPDGFARHGLAQFIADYRGFK